MRTNDPSIGGKRRSWLRLTLDFRFEILLALCWGLLILVAFLAPVSLTLDGPSHFYGAYVLRQLLRHRPAFQAHFSYNSILIPNWLATVVLAALASVMQARVAMAVMMTLVGTALLAGLYSCASALGGATWSLRHRSHILLILTPLAICMYLTVAFWGFLISSAICFHVAGKLLRGGSAAALNRQFRIAMMLVLACWAHPLPVVFSGVFLVCVFAAELGHTSGEQSSIWKGTLTKFTVAAWPWLIPAGLCLWYVAHSTPSATAANHFSIETLIWTRLLQFLRMDGLIEMSPTPTSAGAFVLLLGVLITAAVRKPKHDYPRERGISFFVLAVLAAYFLLPDSAAGGSWIPTRILFTAAVFVTVHALSPGRLEGRQTSLCCLLATICIFFFAGEYLWFQSDWYRPWLSCGQPWRMYREIPGSLC